MNDPVNIGNPQRDDAARARQADPAAEPARASEIVFRPLPVDDPKVRQPDITARPHAARLGARVDVEEGLRQTIEWFRQALDR